MASNVAIANKALRALSCNGISSFTEDTKEAQSISDCWDIVRRDLLRLHPWNFAIKRIELAQSSTAPIFGYAYAYAIPSDYIAIREVYDDEDYKLENGFILSNINSCKIRYIYDVTDAGKWAADFTNLMSARLTAELSYSFTVDKDLILKFWQNYYGLKEQAQFSDAVEDTPETFLQFPSELIMSRY